MEQIIGQNNEFTLIFPHNRIDCVSSPNDKFQPMNANYGIMPELSEKIRDKKMRYEKISDRAIGEMNIFINENITKILQ